MACSHAARGCRRCRTGSIGQAKPRGQPLTYLVFQLQYDALAQLGPHAAGRSKRLVVSRGNSQNNSVRAEYAEDGKPHLRPHARNARQKAEHRLALFVGKAKQRHIILGDIHTGIQCTGIANSGQRARRSGRDGRQIPHAAAAYHGVIRRFFQQLPCQAVDHNFLRSFPRAPKRIFYLYACIQLKSKISHLLALCQRHAILFGTVAVRMADGHSQRVGRVVRFGHGGQLQKRPGHFLHLLFCGLSVA